MSVKSSAEFKVGDKIRLTGTEWSKATHGVEAGDVVTVNNLRGDLGVFHSPEGTFPIIPTSYASTSKQWGGVVVEDVELENWHEAIAGEPVTASNGTITIPGTIWHVYRSTNAKIEVDR